jgi:hypothetical protein
MIIRITPSTFSYICQEYTIFPGIVREQLTEDFASGYSKTSIEFSNKRDTDSNINKLRNYIINNF